MDTKTEKNKTEAPKPLTFRDNPEVKERIAAFKEANPEQANYYSRLVKEYPDRAIDTLIYRDVQKHDSDMKLIEKQLPQAREFYKQQTPEAKARIDADMANVSPYYKDKVFVNAVFRENDRQTRKQFAAPTAKDTPGNAAGADVPKPPRAGRVAA